MSPRWIAIALTLAACEAPPPEPAPEAVPTLRERLDAMRAELPPEATDALTTPVPIEGGAAALARLRRSLDNIVAHDATDLPDGAGSPQARIAMLGSSHIASDLVSGLLRERLQRHFGDAGHGYVTALPPFETYWQWGATVEDGEGWAVLEASAKFTEVSALGPNGMAFEAFEPAWAELSVEAASHIELHYWAQNEGGVIQLSLDGQPPIAVPTEAEESSAAIAYVAVPDGRHRVRLETDGSGPVRVFGVAFEREAPGVLVDQLGLNATTAAHLLQNDEASQALLLGSRRSDLYVVWLGANEASESWPIEVQTQRFEDALDRLSDAMPDAGCLVIGPLDRRQHDPEGHPFVPAALAPIAAMHREVALARGCAFYDARAWQLGEGAVERFEAAHPPLIRGDRVHLTYEGYLRFGADLLRSLLDALED